VCLLTACVHGGTSPLRHFLGLPGARSIVMYAVLMLWPLVWCRTCNTTPMELTGVKHDVVLNVNTLGLPNSWCRTCNKSTCTVVRISSVYILSPCCCLHRAKSGSFTYYHSDCSRSADGGRHAPSCIYFLSAVIDSDNVIVESLQPCDPASVYGTKPRSMRRMTLAELPQVNVGHIHDHAALRSALFSKHPPRITISAHVAGQITPSLKCYGAVHATISLLQQLALAQLNSCPCTMASAWLLSIIYTSV
jgi:hypothetical protein